MVNEAIESMSSQMGSEQPTPSSQSSDGSDSYDSEELELFQTVHPLKALCKMSIGPLFSQIAIALGGVINSIWVSKRFGKQGTAALGNVGVIEFIPNAIASYLSTCISAQISYLFGIGKKDKTAQLYIDFLRISLILGIVLPAILVPLSPILLKWDGASPELIEASNSYLLFPQYGSFFNILFQMNCGLLEVMGKYSWYAYIQLFSFILNCGILDPLLLLVFKTPLWGVSFATLISQALPALVLTVFIFCGKFTIKPKLRMLASCFERETLDGLGAGISDLVEYLSYDIPLILFLKYLGNSANASGVYEEAMTAINGINKIEQVNQAVCYAIGEGLLPLASYSFGFKNYNRIFWLMVHSMWVMLVWTGMISGILLAFPKTVASIWGHSEAYLNIASKMIWIYGVTDWMSSFQFVYPQVMIATKHKLSATIYSVLSLSFPIPVFSMILYRSNTRDPSRLTWALDIADVFTIVIGALFMIHPLIVINRGSKDSLSMNSQPLLNEETKERLDS